VPRVSSADDGLEQLAPALANPYGDPAAHQAALALAAERSGELQGKVAAWLQAGRAKDARRLLLCLGLGRERQGLEPLDSAALPERLFADLGFSRGQLEAVLGSASRCRARLDELAGSSRAAHRLRADAWTACFGSSLDDALRLRHVIRQQNVLLLGETGTGKELVARALRDGDLGDGSSGARAPSQALNAAAVPADLWETELFGHVRGAFSGAVRDRQGKIVAADGGTLFLDEIGDMPPAVQPKLLRAIETNHVSPIGSNDEVTVDVRYLAATSLLLEERVAKGLFRRDLYERLAGIVLTLPPLRERPDDVLPIARAILRRLQGEEERRQSRGDPAASIFVRLAGHLEEWDLSSYDWPGNVRELENFIRMRILGFGGPPRRGPGAPETTSPPPSAPPPNQPVDRSSYSGSTPPGSAAASDPGLERLRSLEATLDEVRDWYIQAQVARHAGRRALAAQALGMDRNTLTRHLKRMNQAGDEEEE
jgi:DNA-binding NtrC family response regulator